jgi:chromosomal replication initiator protein
VHPLLPPYDTPLPTDPRASWHAVLDLLTRRLDADTIELWITPLVPLSCDSGTLVLTGAPHLVAWVRARYAGLLDETVRSAGVASSVRLVESDGTPRELGHPQPVGERRFSRSGEPAAAPEPVELGDPLDPALTFDNFVIGESNRLAHAAALQVAEQPAGAFNPLLLVGPPGVGKTHLLHAIAGYLEHNSPELRVHLCTSERFVTDFVAALQARRAGDFKKQLRQSDVLLVDDVQFLAAKSKTEEEFFHTFNALQRSGAQLVLTSDRVPQDLQELEERLRARFSAGLVVDLARPDEKLRRTYLARRASEVVEHPEQRAQLGRLADRVTDNIRSLEGALVRTMAFHSLTGREIDHQLVDDVVGRLYPKVDGRTERPSIARVQDVVCAHYELDRETLLGPSRAAKVAWPRQVAMYLARQHTEASLHAIAKAFKRSDHTTVLHAHKRVVARLKDDETVHTEVRGLVDELS